jgi:CBS domain-containing protein
MAKKSKSNLDKLASSLKSVKAKDIMTGDVITTREDVTLEKVANTMVKKRISGMPVIGKRDNIVGIISEADLFVVMDMIESGDAPADAPEGGFSPTVKFAMSTDVVKVRKTTSLHEIISIVKYQNIHTLPVVSGKKLVGVIGRHDIFKNFYKILRSLK